MRQIFRFFALVIFVMPGLGSSSQNLARPAVKKYLRCYTAERMTEFRKTHPNAETDEQFEAWLGQKIKERKKETQRPAANYTIPVIFHIIHNGETVGVSPNLDANLVGEQILQVNKDFANLSNSPYGTSAPTGIQFVLAQKDPLNNILTEPGIDRINRNDKGWNDYTSGWTIQYVDGTVKPSSRWNANSYFNVWVIPALNNGTNDILGYATFPSMSFLPGLNNNETDNTAGVAILSGTVGSTFSPNSCGFGYGMGKTLAHESGHFFGLRHIWGDANCGNDFCDDTPIHFGANYGLPTHPKSNSCGTTEEMFENFMDYCDDILLNTFTANQVERMQTVMLNSPRRLSLTTSSVGAVTVTGSNRISFINCTGNQTVWEKGINSAYPRYKDVSFTLNAEDKATGDATVTVSASGSAINGLQYQLLTPTLVFAAGDNFKPVNIRIFDNARVDGDRTIVLNYTIAGTGVTTGSNAQSLTINLLDDDNMRVGENTINLLNENFEKPTGTFGLPTGWTLLTTGGYVNRFVASINGDAGGTGLCAHITNNTTTKPNVYTKGVAGAAVLQSPVIDAGSVLSLGDLSFTYKTRGLDDNDYAILTYNPAAAPTGPFNSYGNASGYNGYGPYSSNTATINNTPVIPAPLTVENRKFNISFYWETSELTTGSNPGFNVDNILLPATPFHVETSVSDSYTFDIQSGNNVNNFKSTNNKAIASIRNASANISSVTVKVTQAGTGNVAVNTAAGGYLRTQKVFQISPAIANSTTSYQATLYFTAAELAIWGSDKLNLKILKVNDGVSLNGTLTTANAEIITPAVVEDVAAGFITYTGNFTGFSQFMLVSPLTSLPVSLISFQASALQKNIQLIWSTTQETNNRGFIIERGLNGSNYTKIGWVNGNGTTALTSTYNFTDNYVQRNITYYYRIRQVDIDNRQVYSPVRNARLKPGPGISIGINPNPVKDYVNLFITGTANKATIELINSSGQKLIRKNDVNAFDGAYNLQLKGLASGVYTIVVYLPEGAFARKLIVQ
ncbi:MAG: M43 family zinc metalloprotease [Ferruginibacter sp.]